MSCQPVPWLCQLTENVVLIEVAVTVMGTSAPAVSEIGPWLLHRPLATGWPGHRHPAELERDRRSGVGGDVDVVEAVLRRR